MDHSTLVLSPQESDGTSVADSGVATDPSLDGSSVAGSADADATSLTSADPACQRAATLPHKLQPRRADWDELDDLLQVCVSRFRVESGRERSVFSSYFELD